MLPLLAQITLNLTAWHFYISLLGAVLAIATFSYRISRANKSDMSAKLDCTTFVEFKKDTISRIDLKANQCDLDRFYAEIWQEVEERSLSHKLDVARIEKAINDNQIETHKTLMQVVEKLGTLDGTIKAMKR
jgi:hypothetical protein